MADSGSSILATSTASPRSANLSDPPKTYTFYYAAPLFTIAELHTNVLLARAIQQQSAGKFIPVLPQDLEQRDLSPHSIRDEDLRALVSCDLGLFTYDGAELDAGTVVEFTVSKMLDIPGVILRTDFRGAGDQNQGGQKGDSWNLMSSNWPRSVGVRVNAMVEYKKSLAGLIEAEDGKREPGGGHSMIDEVAKKVVEGFETVLEQKPRLPKELRSSVYQWLGLMPGFRDGSDKSNIDAFSKLCEDKVAKGLL